MKKLALLVSVFFCLIFSDAQPSRLDPTFGKNGLVRTNIGVDYDYTYPTAGRQIFVQSDGKISILIEAPLSYITRRLPDGLLDLSYGNNGYSEPVRMVEAHALQQPDGKIVLAGIYNGIYTIARYNTDGMLDNLFGEDGKQTIEYVPAAIAIQSDGKILAAGYFQNPDLITTAKIRRYNTNGSIDNNFVGEENSLESATAIAIQNDGRIVVTGRYVNGNSNDFGIVRYNSNGILDNSFSDDGKQTTDFNSSDDIVKSLAIQSDGKIVTTGYSQKDTNISVALVRYNSDGSLDQTFGSNGKQENNFGPFGVAESIVVQSDGKIIVAGWNNSDFIVIRYDTNGSLDETFNSSGKQETIFDSPSYALSVALQSDGKIIAGGSTNGQFAVARYNADGNLDNSFDADGKLTAQLEFKQGSTFYKSTAIQNDGKIVAAGYGWNGTNYDFALARYNVDGTLDNSFADQGKQTTNFTSDNDYAYAVAIQKDGKIVLAGVAGNVFALTRYNTDGTLDNTFGNHGKQTTALGSSSSATSVIIQGDGKIVAAGTADHNFAISRYNADGSLDNSFSNDGKLTTDFSVTGSDGGAAVVRSLAVQSNEKIIAAGETTFYLPREGAGSYFAIACYNTDGSLDSTFGNNGRQTTNFFPGRLDVFSYANSVAIQADDRIIVAGYTKDEQENFTLARYNPNGSLDHTFSGDGMQITDLGFPCAASSVALQNDGKIIAAGAAGLILPFDSDFAVARYNIDGSLDSSFSSAGIQITAASAGRNNIENIVISNNKLYASGLGQHPGNLGIIARYLLDENNPTPPTVSLTAPTNNATYLAPAARIRLFAVASDKDGSISKVEFYNGNSLLHTETVAPYGFKWTDVPAGDYKLIAKAYDNSGNVTTSDAVHISVVPNKPPIVSIIAPANNEHYAAPAYIHFEAAASDTDGRITRVEFYNGSTLLRTEYKYPYTYVWKNVPVGTYTITAVATDNWGAHTTSAPIVVKVKPQTEAIVSSRASVNNKNSLNDEQNLKIYPSPANQTLNIYTKGLQQNKPATISIISVSGIVLKKLQMNSLPQMITIDVSGLVRGGYALKVICGDKVLYQQFVKL